MNAKFKLKSDQVRARSLAGRKAALAVVTAGVALVAGCGSDFQACQESRTCPPSGEGGEPGKVGNAGEAASTAGSGQAEGGSGGGTGGTQANEGGGNAGTAGAPAAGGTPSGSESGGEPNNGSAGEPNGGFGGEAGAGATDGGGTVDTNPPTVLSVSPANNAKGVADDATITVTWSEPMNKATAQASFQCPDLAGKVTFEWPSATVMKVVPVSKLVYAAGKHADLASIAPKTYSITLNNSAEDAAGNELASAYAFKFATLRRVTWSATAYTNGNSWVLSSKGTVRSGDVDTGIFVGDLADNAWQRLALQFDITGVPTAAVGIASATLGLFMSGGSPNIPGAPFTNLGNVLVDHLSTAKIDSTTLLLERLRAVGTLVTATALEGVKTVDATQALAEDLARRSQRGNRSQFRVQFGTTTNGDSKSDGVYFLYDSNPSLTLDYLVP